VLRLVALLGCGRRTGMMWVLVCLDLSVLAFLLGFRSALR
jgi:hypothetical protein